MVDDIQASDILPEKKAENIINPGNPVPPDAMTSLPNNFHREAVREVFTHMVMWELSLA